MWDVLDPRIDKSVLLSRQDATGANLAARADIYSWQKPTFDFVGWVLDQHRWQIGDRVLDLGCGYGAYVPHLKARGAEVIAVDLSMGMLAEARAKGVPLVCADAQSLALRSGAFDAAIAPLTCSITCLISPWLSGSCAMWSAREGRCWPSPTLLTTSLRSWTCCIACRRTGGRYLCQGRPAFRPGGCARFLSGRVRQPSGRRGPHRTEYSPSRAFGPLSRQHSFRRGACPWRGLG